MQVNVSRTGSILKGIFKYLPLIFGLRKFSLLVRYQVGSLIMCFAVSKLLGERTCRKQKAQEQIEHEHNFHQENWVLTRKNVKNREAYKKTTEAKELPKQKSRKKEYKQIILYDMKNSTCLLESLCLNHVCPESFFGVWVFFWVWDLSLFFSWTTGISPRPWWGQGTICGICNPTNPKARPGRSINRKNNLWCCLKKTQCHEPIRLYKYSFCTTYTDD